MKYVIGIDGGTQSTKVSIFDLQGNVVCQVGRQLKPLYLPTADVAEHPGDDLWESLCASCRELMEQFILRQVCGNVVFHMYPPL